MAKKKTTANYRMGDLVVVKSTDWNKNVKYEVGMVTNVRYATQLTKKTYDIRTEAGTALIYTGVDEPKSKQTIVSSEENVIKRRRLISAIFFSSSLFLGICSALLVQYLLMSSLLSLLNSSNKTEGSGRDSKRVLIFLTDIILDLYLIIFQSYFPI